MKAHAIYQSQNNNTDELLNKDVWLASDVGLKPDGVHRFRISLLLGLKPRQ